MADIKTRDTVKGTIKTLDKAAIAGQKMKQAYIATKDKAEHSVNAKENTAEEYAADKTEAGIDEIAHKGAYAFNKAGRKGVQETKKNIQSAKDGIQRFKQQRAEKSINVQRTQGRITTVGSSSAQTQTSSAIKTLEKPEKMVKQSATSAGKKNIKLASKEAAKTTQRSVKTAEHTAKASIKTSQQTAKAAQKTAQATVKASQKAAQAAKATAKATANAVKAAAKATIATVKAIIAGTKALVAAIAAGGWIAVVIIMIVVLLGSAVAMFGGGSESNTYTQVSAEVESPIDMERIKLALQGYNFGNGYISWAKSKYGGYSYANAVEFSTQQAQRLGWDSYGDTQYPAHVLRYYPYGRAFTAGSNQGIVEVALTQIGNEGGQPYWSWYGFDSRVEWCACFVSWCADQCGYIDSGLIPKFAGCIDGANWFKSNNRWNDRNYEPKAGDIIFFDWEDDGTTDHVGIVEKCENGTVYTVEGNSGDACRQRQYTVGSRNIYGYGIPAY